MQLLGPLDALRRDAMAAVLARPRLGAWITRRDARLVLVATFGIVFALAVTCLVPAAALVLAPIALGVPHVASDARYLVLRRGLQSGVVAIVVVGAASMLALRIAEGVVDDPSRFASYELALGGAWAGVLAFRAASVSGAWGRAIFVLAGLGALTSMALRAPDHARIVLAHGHNLVGVALWALLFRRRRRPLVPIALALAAAVLFAGTGMPLRIAHALGTDHALGMSMDDAAAMLAPGLATASAGASVLVASYVLLQGVHYAVWLGWIPQDDLRGEGTLTFGMTVRGLVRDFRPLGLVAIGLTWLVVIVGALFSARGARDTYLSLASFHAYVELAMLAYFLVAGVPRAAAVR